MKTGKHATQIQPKPVSISKFAKILGKLGGRPKKETSVGYTTKKTGTSFRS